MPANPVEQNQEVELAKSRAESRLADQKDTVAESESRAPQTQKADLLPQEYGMPLESEDEKEDEAPDEEPEEESEGSGEEEPDEGEEMQNQMYNEAMQRGLILSTIWQMRNRKVLRAIANEEKIAKEKIAKKEKELKKAIKEANEKSALKVIGRVMGWGFTFFYLLLIPLIIAIFISMSVAILVWGCGFNMGNTSSEIKKLQNNFKKEKKSIIKNKNEQTKKLLKNIKKI